MYFMKIHITKTYFAITLFSFRHKFGVENCNCIILCTVMPMNSRRLPILSSIHKHDTIEETTSDTDKEKTSNKLHDQ